MVSASYLVSLGRTVWGECALLRLGHWTETELGQELFEARRVPEPPKGLGLDLPNAFACHAVARSNLFKRHRVEETDAIAHTHNIRLLGL